MIFIYVLLSIILILALIECLILFERNQPFQAIILAFFTSIVMSIAATPIFSLVHLIFLINTSQEELDYANFEYVKNPTEAQKARHWIVWSQKRADEEKRRKERLEKHGY